MKLLITSELFWVHFLEIPFTKLKVSNIRTLYSKLQISQLKFFECSIHTLRQSLCACSSTSLHRQGATNSAVADFFHILQNFLLFEKMYEVLLLCLTLESVNTCSSSFSSTWLICYTCFSYLEEDESRVFFIVGGECACSSGEMSEVYNMGEFRMKIGMEL